MKIWSKRTGERLEGALNSADALSTLEISSDMKAISKNTHLLVKMYPKRNFSFFDVNVSSPYVCQELVKRNWQKRRKALLGAYRGGEDYRHWVCLV